MDGPNRRRGGTGAPPIRGDSAAIAEVFAWVSKIAPTAYPVLITGETGAGKEVIARQIHNESGRTGPFIPVNCGAIPESLFEAELFGAERGTYTGQVGARIGMFQAAHNGTLFLDEIGELPAGPQAKLLRVLQDGEIRPLGANTTTRVSVRVVAATNRDLRRMSDDGGFRADLYFRLGAATVHVPPLRERLDDLAALLNDAAVDAARVQGVAVPQIDPQALAIARRYPWPGNVRELRYAVAQAMMAAAGGPVLKAEHFSIFAPPRRASVPNLEFAAAAFAASHPRTEAPATFSATPSGSPAEPIADDPHAPIEPFFEALAAFERRYMRLLLARTGNNLSHASEIAGISRSALRDKARAYGLLNDNPDVETPRPRSRARRG